jgi:phage-related protein
MGEMAETLGTALLPVFDALADVLNDYVAPALETGIPIAIDAVKAALAGLAPVFGFIQGLFSGAGEQSEQFSGILADLGEMWSLVSDIIVLEAQAIWDVVVPIFTAIMEFLGAHSKEINAILGAAWTIIKTSITVTLGVIKGVITAVLAVIKGDWAGAWEAVKGIFSTVWEGIKTILGAALTIIKAELSIAWDVIKGAVSSAWEGIKNAVSSAWDGIKSAVTSKIGEIKELLLALPAQLVNVGASIVQSIWDGMRSKWDELVAWFSDKLQKLKDQLPFSEPKDSSSPLAGLSKAGASIVGQIQSGIEGADPLRLGGLAQSTLRGGASSTSGALSTTTVRIVFDAGELKKMIKATIEDTLTASGTQSLSRIRTGN